MKKFFDKKRHKIGNKALNKEISERLIEASVYPVDYFMEEIATSPHGLCESEVKKRLDDYGENQVAHEKPPAWYIQLLLNFKNPFILILLGLDLFSFFTGDTEAVIIITTMVLISVLITFTQEFRSMKTAEKLKAMVKTTTTVIRQSTEKEIDMEQLVPGDIIRLSAGDLVPADVRLLTSKDLFVSESALTGEALPVEKQELLPLETVNQKNPLNALELANICYMGTNIVSGSATAIVIATGASTYFGSMAKTLIGKRPLTSFDKGVNSVTFVLIRFMLIMVPIIFFINGFTKGDWWDAFFFGLSVAVGLTPEMLPVIVTANLAKGAVVMARNKVIMKRLHAIQNFGAMDILCTDKTGTLTQDKIILEKYLNINGDKDTAVLEYAYLNSYYQTGLKNLLDVAVLEHAGLSEVQGVEGKYTKVDEIPFDFNRRRMSVVLKKNDNGHILICKGAMEEIVSICTHVSSNGKVVPITPHITQKIQRLVHDLNTDGLRVVAVAVKQTESEDRPYTITDESNMILVGYIGFLDPPKDSAAAAIKALRENGVNIKVLTGDNETVTRKVCKDVGLHVNQIVLGNDIDNLSDEQLADMAERTTVFAKLNPLQKARIVRALQSKGHTVGFMGDGINDAASLREADVGISVDTAVDIAKESADIILLEKSLLVLEQGVIEGRKTFGNIIKYIKMTASSNFGNVFSVLGASAFLPFLPMLPIHLLIQNLFYDISQLSIPWDNMDKEFLKKPKKWDAKSIRRFMIFIGPISSIFDYVTYFVMWYIFAANTVDDQSLFQSGWFIEGLLSQTLIVHMIRTEKIPFIQSRASLPVLLLTSAIIIAGIYIPFSAFGASIGLQPLPMSYFPWLIAILLSYCLLTQVIKKWYIRKFNEWL
ncbi:magnesium-translocating P-type ATPase [Aneurinibacillus aneurinilyticus]|uniref:magnesium-translocating P-type ATPase n=1 Tax=Aneurinibacillus aneurinilyticus TaxID=1391 RepID=UPI002E1EDC11|nr:magnesium-translocating P-type ATPase [Aneurinibacillus aneurinilyticus]MED0671053.1 magnesium-translocating P-type ATPase [Aneurinibacillus aneurinilyticus]